MRALLLLSLLFLGSCEDGGKEDAMGNWNRYEVPGGWIYTNPFIQASTVFVPFPKEEAK